MVRLTALVVVLLVLLFAPLSGNAQSLPTFDIPIYNSGFVVPETYFYVASSAFVDDGAMISAEDYYISGYVAIVSGVSGRYGDFEKTVTIYTSDYYRDYLGLRADDVFEWTGKHYVFCTSDLLSDFASVASSDAGIDNFIEFKYSEPNNNMFSLVSGYPMYSVITYGEYGMLDVTLAVTLDKFLSQGISVNGSYVTSSDAASVDDLLTLPTPPPAQRDFIDDTSIARFGYYVGSFIPHALLLPLFSFIGFCLLMALFALIKHA